MFHFIFSEYTRDICFILLQSVCEPLASGLWNQAEDTPSAFSRNNEALISRGSVSISRPVIPVLNNFESALPAQYDFSCGYNENNSCLLLLGNN